MKVGAFIPEIEITMDVWSQKFTQTHYQCLEYAIIAHFEMISSSL